MQPVINLPEFQGPRQPAVLPPIGVRSSGRPRRDNTTRRDPSHWEIPQRSRPHLSETVAISAAATAAATVAAAAAIIVATATAIQRRTSSLSPPAATPWTDWA